MLKKRNKKKTKNLKNLENKKSKKILFVSQFSGVFGSLYQFHAPPLGIMRLAGYLNSKGHYAEYFDPNLYACNKKGLSLEETFAKEKWDANCQQFIV